MHIFLIKRQMAKGGGYSGKRMKKFERFGEYLL